MVEGAPARPIQRVFAPNGSTVSALRQRPAHDLTRGDASRVQREGHMWPLHDALADSTRADDELSRSGSGPPRSRSEVRAYARGPAAMYLALTGGGAHVSESQRTFSRTTLALAAIVLYAL